MSTIVRNGSCDTTMKITLIVILGCIFIPKISSGDNDNVSFPKNFKLGAGTSAFQIEGAWNVNGKGPSIWDAWAHNCPECITDHRNADDACKSYYKYREDVAILKEIGFDFYRFSISWPRIMPTGFSNNVSKDGIRYYKNVINELLKNGIEPVVTIYHFDHPQMLEEMGGWMNKAMVDRYAEYARIVFKEFGPLVKIFVTINEPQQLCQGYSTLGMAPGKLIVDNIGYYLCIQNTLKAHARAYHIYNEEFRPHQHGQVGIISACSGFVFNHLHDNASADTAFQFYCGLVSHPIHKGDYPPIVKKRLALVSKAQGYEESRLPTLSPEWISYIKGTYDFFGLNHYTSGISMPDPNEALGKYNSDSGIINFVDPSWSHSSWVNILPEGFRNLLRKIKEEYYNPVLYVFENGYPTRDRNLTDYDRIRYFSEYAKAMILAIKQDGCRVQRYSVWSLLDNFELHEGFTQRFGIVDVNFDSPNKERTFKLSAFWWKTVIRNRRISDDPRV